MATYNTLLEQAQDHKTKARLMAVSCSETGTWLSALPVASLGLHMSDDVVRIAAGLRLGIPLCRPHPCISCDADVNVRSTHGLSCSFSKGWHSRYASINDIIKWALESAKVPCHLEPTGFFRSDGKRPDGASKSPRLGCHMSGHPGFITFVVGGEGGGCCCKRCRVQRPRNTRISQHPTTLFPLLWRHWGYLGKMPTVCSKRSQDEYSCRSLVLWDERWCVRGGRLPFAIYFSYFSYFFIVLLLCFLFPILLFCIVLYLFIQHVYKKNISCIVLSRLYILFSCIVIII